MFATTEDQHCTLSRDMCVQVYALAALLGQRSCRHPLFIAWEYKKYPIAHYNQEGIYQHDACLSNQTRCGTGVNRIKILPQLGKSHGSWDARRLQMLKFAFDKDQVCIESDVLSSIMYHDRNLASTRRTSYR